MIVLLNFPLTNTFAAEVLQVRSSTILQIGDRNRSYTVKIACLEVDPSNEVDAMNSLKSLLRRKKRVNLKPQGAIDGVLLARVDLIESKIDIGQSLEKKGLGSMKC